MVVVKSIHTTMITSNSAGTERENFSQMNTITNEYTEAQSSSRFETDQKQATLNAAEIQNQKPGGRKRMRHIYNSIRLQMEFYFGDPNLSKDRFLKQLVDKDPYVPLEVFLTFNKIKGLTQNVSQIAKSLSNSQLLELDASGQKVRRRTALGPARDVDKRTLYVEGLPVTANHDWVRQVFHRFGEIAYVSLPRYAVSRKIKEFAFIEFENESSVEKAIKAFQHFDGVLTLQTANPADLTSIQAYMREQQLKQDEYQRERLLSEQAEPGVLETIGEELAQSQTEEILQMAKNFKSRKRRRSIVETEDNVVARENDCQKPKQPALKHVKINSNFEVKNEDSELGSVTEITEPHERNVGHVDDINKKLLDQVNFQKKKKKNKFKLNDLDMDPSCFDMKVLPKRDWKLLRNKYLNLQREKVAERKNQRRQQMHKCAITQQKKIRPHSIGSQKYDNLSNNDDPLSPVPTKRLKVDNNASSSSSGSCGDRMHKMSMNFYGAGDGELDDTNYAVGVKSSNINKGASNWAQRGLTFTCELGLIVEINLLEPCVNVKEFKADMRQYAMVKYIDIKEGATQAYLRSETASAAEQLVELLNCAEYKCEVLRGKAEMRYWKKIEADREAKLNKKIKLPQKRGRERIQKLMGTHIRFDDGDYADAEQKDIDVIGSALNDNAEGTTLCGSYQERISE